MKSDILMPVKTKVKNGDILSIPVGDNLCAIAQVLSKKSIMYVVVFSELRNCGSIDPQDAISGLPALVGWTMDAKIYRGDWEVIGRSEVRNWENLKKNYKVEYHGKMWVESFDGELLHEASDDENEKLFNRSSYSPVRLERAIRAYNKLESWNSEFDDLLAE